MRTRILLAGFVFTALSAAGTAWAADPRLLNLVMPDATTLAGANVTNAEITPFGQYVLSQMTSAMGQQLQAFVTATGFDPRHDVTEILAASSSTPGAASHSGLLLALGNFPVSQMTAAIAQKAPQLVQNYGGATLIAGPDGKSGIAFLGTNIAIAGDVASVKAAVDRSVTQNALSPALSVQLQALSTTEDAWALTIVPASSLIPAGASSQAGPFANVLSSIQASSGGVKFGSTVQITAQAVESDAASAKSLADGLQALTSLLSMAGAQNPQAASVVQLLQGLTVTTSGATVNLALSIPETQIEGLLNGMKNQAAPAVRRGIQPAIQPVH